MSTLATSAKTNHVSHGRRLPSPAALQTLKTARTSADLGAAIAALAPKVCALYGTDSAQYEQAFDDLHYLRMFKMAAEYRAARGLAPNAATPYDEPDVVALIAA